MRKYKSVFFLVKHLRSRSESNAKVLIPPVFIPGYLKFLEKVLPAMFILGLYGSVARVMEFLRSGNIMCLVKIVFAGAILLGLWGFEILARESLKRELLKRFAGKRR